MPRIHMTSIEDAPSFTTTPSKIAMEHQVEVRDLTAEGRAAAGEPDPLAEAYKQKFGLSDEGAAIQAMLNRFSQRAGPDWKRTPIGPDAILLERADGDA